MNVDQNRDRVKIQDFDPNTMKRVAFRVDVEIAGIAGYAEEEHEDSSQIPSDPQARRQSTSAAAMQHKKDTKEARFKDKGEGAALKNPQFASQEKEMIGKTTADAEAEIANTLTSSSPPLRNDSEPTAERPKLDEVTPPSRKKEKKKRSEAERKERKERKRKAAEANGELPLELTKDDDDDDSSMSTPPGASTPQTGDMPTTDPLRIYKRCCQLRESFLLTKVVEEISRPSATFAEAPGTVAVVDLSDLELNLSDVTTLSDWLAVVPVRKLVLDDCDLDDECVRVVLAGLRSCKSLEQARLNKKLPRRGSGKSGIEQMGVIEKLSLKNNPRITHVGWKHIALFLHVCRSLRAIDLSNNPFPGSGELSRVSTMSAGSNVLPTTPSKPTKLTVLFSRALAERPGKKLEELIMTNCSLTASNVDAIVDSVMSCNIKRLGLGHNELADEAYGHVARYVKAGQCEGLDLSSNDLHGRCNVLADALRGDNNPFLAVSLSDCNLDSSDLEVLLPRLAALQNFRFLDLSKNKGLFETAPNSVAVLRKYLPRMKALKRLHLNDVGLTSEQTIAIAEILPECVAFVHLSILENAKLASLLDSKEAASQEEACALLASLMTAIRVSHRIVAIEMEIPSAESSEVIKALSSQIMAYCLRNMEHDALSDGGTTANSIVQDKDQPEVLLHLVGHMDDYPSHDNDDPAPDEDYVIASTGIVKALGVCLGTGDGSSRSQSRNISPARSGTVTPRQYPHEAPLRPKLPNQSSRKPRDMSKELLESARKIRMRLKPAMIKQDRAGNDVEYSKPNTCQVKKDEINNETGKLQFLDATLERMIQRFEHEYPETRVPSDAGEQPRAKSPLEHRATTYADTSIFSASTSPDSGLSRQLSAEQAFAAEANGEPHVDSIIKIKRSESGASLAAKAQAEEEGRMHRFGQNFRRDILPPSGTLDYAHGTTESDPAEAAHLQVLRSKLERYKGEELREKIVNEGADSVLQEIGANVEELRHLEKEDPVAFDRYRQSELVRSMDAGKQLQGINGSLGYSSATLS